LAVRAITFTADRIKRNKGAKTYIAERFVFKDLLLEGKINGD
jgi:hypothetical protein